MITYFYLLSLFYDRSVENLALKNGEVTVELHSHAAFLESDHPSAGETSPGNVCDICQRAKSHKTTNETNLGRPPGRY